MGLEYIFPRVAIDESNAGPRPVQGVSMSTIGLVGTFCKGPVNTPITIGSLDKLVEVFGGYKKELTGYKSALAAFSQGANDFKVVRVGSATIKEASVKLKSAADADVVDVKALTPGTWGNDIKVSVVAGTANGTFKLIVIFFSKTEEFDNLTLDNLATVQSKYVSVSKLDGAAAIPKNIAAVSLTAGDDGAVTADTDYVGAVAADGKRSGLKVLETVKANIIIAAQQTSSTIRNALITHCANMTPGYGLRIAVLNPDKGMTTEAATALTAALDNMRGILSYPWNELADIPGEYIAPDGFYAGRLAALNSNQSPSNKLINGIVSQERTFTDADIKALTLARISPITLEEGRGFRIRNGVTLSSDPAWSQISIRRVFDELEMIIYDGTQWAKSEDNTPELREAMATQIDSVLAVFKQQRKIYDYKPTVCDDTNNTPETIAARILNTKISVRPIYAADFIDHSIQRLLGNEGN